MSTNEGSYDVGTVPKSKSSLWKIGLAGIRQTLMTQRRHSTRIITDMVNNLDHVIDGEDNALAFFLSWLEKVTHVNRRYLIVGTFLFAVSYLSIGRNAASLCNILIMTYPIYISIKATENCQDEAKEQWLMYWIVYGIVTIAEIFLEMFLVWLPMYYVFKFLLFCWCMSPSTANGSYVIYANIIRPLFREHNYKLEMAFSAVTQHLNAEKSACKQDATLKQE